MGNEIHDVRARTRMAPSVLRTMVACIAFGAGAAHAGCATSIAQLRSLFDDPAFPLKWEETSMADARPLMVTLGERAGGLFISFVKTGAGLMAEGPARVCRTAEGVEARFLRDGLRLGDAANWLLRGALGAGAAVRMQRSGLAELRISAAGWRGEFAPGPSQLGLQAR